MKDINDIKKDEDEVLIIMNYDLIVVVVYISIVIV